MQLKFIKAGLQTSIQDGGRVGMMQHGVSLSGAMDPVSMQLANWLVSKPLQSALIEITLIGPTIGFSDALTLAICGASCDLLLNDEVIASNETFSVKKGDVLKFLRIKEGARAYLAFSGELVVAPVLSSYSTHLTAKFGGFSGRAFVNEDSLALTDIFHPEPRKLPKELSMSFTGKYLMRTVKTVESAEFSFQQQQAFYAQSYRISVDSNRMGIRLTGHALNLTQSKTMVSSGLLPGSVQIPPSGLPIISSVDGPTMGGYPRIAHIISADHALLGQLKAQDKIRFTLINKTQALKILLEKKRLLDLFLT